VTARDEGEGRPFPPGYRLTHFSGATLVAWRPDGWPIGAWPLEEEASFVAAERAAWADHAQRAQLIREG